MELVEIIVLEFGSTINRIYSFVKEVMEHPEEGFIILKMLTISKC